MQQKLESILQQQLNPLHMTIVNESFKHNVPKDAESHFKVSIVSDKFTGLNKVSRHRLVMQEIKECMQTIHALSLKLLTPIEWQTSQQFEHETPPCQHKR